MSSRPNFQQPKDEKSSRPKKIQFSIETKGSSGSNGSSLSLSNSISANSLSCNGADSLPAGSCCDTDAALFNFDYELLEGSDDSDDSDDIDQQTYIPSPSKKLRKNDTNDVPVVSNEKTVDKPEFILFGADLSHLDGSVQLAISAAGVIFFNMLYGYLQELIQIQIAGRGFALFLGACQFLGYAFWSWVLAALRTRRIRLKKMGNQGKSRKMSGSCYIPICSDHRYEILDNTGFSKDATKVEKTTKAPSLTTYFALSVIRAIDLALTNLSMKYLNYPAKTLIKSSRVVFTMMMGLVIGKKKYKKSDYTMVAMLVTGLGLFLHADMTTSAVFHPLGVVMLATSLTLDGTVSNWSEVIMTRHNMGQDDFQMKLYSFSFLIMLIAAFQSNELWSGMKFFFMSDGTYSEYVSQEQGTHAYTWTAPGKCIAVFLFSTLGIFGGSCAAAITKRFGALTMSITTTTRKAATIFLSFAAFNNECTPEHIMGVMIFVSGLLLKGVRNHIRMPKFCILSSKSLPK